jgi:hypothetical protein
VADRQHLAAAGAAAGQQVRPAAVAARDQLGLRAGLLETRQQQPLRALDSSRIVGGGFDLDQLADAVQQPAGLGGRVLYEVARRQSASSWELAWRCTEYR